VGMSMMKLDLKMLVLLGGLAVTFGGFYYGTEYRLNALEQQVESVEKRNKGLEIRIQKLLKRVKRLEK